MVLKEYLDNVTEITEESVLKELFEFRRQLTFVNNVNYKNICKVKGLEGGAFCFDGISNSLTAKYLFKKNIERVSFDNSSIAPKVFDYAKQNKFDVIVIGEKETVNKRFVENVKRVHGFESRKIVGISGYLNDEQLFVSVDEVISNEDTLFVLGMGTPKQEELGVKLKKIYPKSCVATCGGFIRQSSESWYFYPVWVTKFHLRAFYRLYKESHTRKRLGAFVLGYIQMLKDIC